MPTIPQQQTIVQYVANSAQSQYTFAFYAPLDTDIQVFYQASNAVPIPADQILTLNTDYTVTYNTDPTTGGYITLLFTATTGYYLTINRQVAASLTTTFSNAQMINGANLDAAFDRLLLLCQQNLNYNLERNLSYVINTYLPNASPYTQLPPLPQNYVWIGTGAGIAAAEIATVPSASVLQSLLANNSPGTDGARLVGYYDAIASNATTVQAYLANLLNSPTINTPIINSPSIITPSITGFANGSSASTGIVGEVISSVKLYASGVSLTSTFPKDITNIMLTPGDWDVWGNVTITPSGGVLTNVQGWANTASQTQPDLAYQSLTQVASAVGNVAYPIPSIPISVSVNTPVYLSCLVNFASGAVSACGGIYARRRR